MTAIQSAVLTEMTAIDDVAPWGPADEQLFEELRAVLERHDASARFGVTLLHKHFEVAPDELLVEVCDVESRTLTTRPCNKSDIAGVKVIETNWRLDSMNATQQCTIACVTDRGGHTSSHVPTRPNA